MRGEVANFLNKMYLKYAANRSSIMQRDFLNFLREVLLIVK